MSKENCILLFARQPVIGRVKKRLARSIGNKMALGVYKFLFNRSLNLINSISADRVVFLSEQLISSEEALANFRVEIQNGEDLGERMANAINWALDEGYENVVLIGSDCFELNSDVIHKAFLKLESSDVVLGPARDGGYYLIGMHDKHNEVFKNIVWGSENVLEQTLQQIRNDDLSYATLQVLSDIDRLEDVYEFDELTALLSEEVLAVRKQGRSKF